MWYIFGWLNHWCHYEWWISGYSLFFKLGGNVNKRILKNWSDFIRKIISRFIYSCIYREYQQEGFIQMAYDLSVTHVEKYKMKWIILLPVIYRLYN